MICKRCAREVILDGVECPLCGKNNQDVSIVSAPVENVIKKEVKVDLKTKKKR